MSIVLGAGGGAINPFVNLARMGFGGRMGDGRQMFSWIHIADVIRAIIHVYENPEISGPVNIASPYRSEEHTSELQSLMRISYAVFCLKKKHQNQEIECYE